MAAESRTPVWFEPVSVAKAARSAGVLRLMHYTSPNQDELVAMANASRATRSLPPLPAPPCLPVGARVGDGAGMGAQHGAGNGAESGICSTAEVGAEARAHVERLVRHLCAVLACGTRNVVLTLGRLGAAWCQIRYVPSSSNLFRVRWRARASLLCINGIRCCEAQRCCCAPIDVLHISCRCCSLAKCNASGLQNCSCFTYLRLRAWECLGH